MGFKTTFIEPQISLLITAYSSPDFKKTTNYFRMHTQRCLEPSPAILTQKLVHVKWHLDSGYATLDEEFLECSRMVITEYHCSSILLNNCLKCMRVN